MMRSIIYAGGAAGQDVKTSQLVKKSQKAGRPAFWLLIGGYGLAGGDSAAGHFDNQMRSVGRRRMNVFHQPVY